MLPGQVLLTPAALMSTLPHQIRLIGGQWKRTRLGVPGMPGLRPTPDRVRETLFNWLGQDLAGWRALDAFAGTGALGLEAASRGAQSVLLVEQDARLAAALRQHQQRLSASAVQVLRGDGVAALHSQPAGSLDVVFLDPPFAAASLYAPALAAAAVSVAVAGSADTAREGADVLLVRDGLSVLPHILAQARRTVRIIRQNLAWAAAYNLLAVPLALAGKVTPWIAALGMSLSSLLVVYNALRMRK